MSAVPESPVQGWDSVIALSEVVAPRYLPLLESEERPEPSRVPVYRGGQPGPAEEPGSV